MSKETNPYMHRLANIADPELSPCRSDCAACLWEDEQWKKKENAKKIVRAINQALNYFNYGKDHTARRFAVKLARDVQRVYTEG